MKEQKRIGGLTKELAWELIIYGIAGLLGIILANSLGIEGVLGQIATLILVLVLGVALLRFEWLYKKIQLILPVILVLLIASIVLNFVYFFKFSEDYRENKYLSITEFPVEIYTYQGRDMEKEGEQGNAWIHFKHTGSDESYRFEYSLPDQGEGYAGLIYRFYKPIDITKYKYIEIKAIFDTGAVCNFWLIDDNKVKNEETILIGDGITPKENISVNITDGIQTITIPIEETFDPIDQNIVRQAEFSVGTYSSRGTNGFLIKSIRFLTE